MMYINKIMEKKQKLKNQIKNNYSLANECAFHGDEEGYFDAMETAEILSAELAELESKETQQEYILVYSC